MNDKAEKTRAGYDASCSQREQDHLNRWPLAKEIYRIAVDGPADWSVRIGIYGEWGSGKSSVLNFIESMALEDGHILFHFNPWQYQSKNELWAAFVGGLSEKVENALGKPLSGRSKRKRKKFFSKITGLLAACVTMWRKDAAKLADVGVGMLIKYLTFSEQDLADLKSSLGGKKILIAIDDLDRVDAKLVPEILYALKEIMDVPSMSFICAFDPVVVGKVLGKAHPGHEDGLKFLEKIIDYPRWLPEPTNEQLIRLAESEITKTRDFVPITEMQHVIPLLPKNPRSVRQFIRVLGLMKPQIERHYPHELHWRVILVANVVKVHLPQYAYSLLRDKDLWRSISQDARYSSKKEEEIKNLTDQYLGNIDGLPPKEEKILRNCINSLSSAIEPWVGLDEESLKYQFNIAEEPHAVTWKEFDQFLESCDRPDEKNVVAWVENHSKKTEDSKERIYDEIIKAAIISRSVSLGKAADSVHQVELETHINRASKLLKILTIVIPLLRANQNVSMATHYEDIVEQISRYFHWKSDNCYIKERKQEENFLNDLLDTNRSDWIDWLKIIPLHSMHWRPQSESEEWENFENHLRNRLQERAVRYIIDQIQSEGFKCWDLFKHSTYGHQFASLFFNLNGILWNQYRTELLTAIGNSGMHMQQNCYHLLAWLIENAKVSSEMQPASQILLKSDFIGALWKNCVSIELNPRMVGSLRKYRETLINDYKLDLRVPDWWHRVCERLDRDHQQSQVIQEKDDH